MGRLIPAGTGFVQSSHDEKSVEVEGGEEKAAETVVVVPGAPGAAPVAPEAHAMGVVPKSV